MRQFLMDMDQIDVALQHFLSENGLYIYYLLFLIVFLKTAVVVLTFLPGDATVFVSGALVAMGELNVFVLFPLLIVATVLGDSSNYSIGKISHQFMKKRSLIPKKTFDRASRFLKKFGSKAIIFARFVPFMRTTIPFISGYTGYPSRKFLTLNAMGGIIWTFLWLVSGILLGQLPVIEEHMTISLAIISCVPFLVPAIIFMSTKLLKKS